MGYVVAVSGAGSSATVARGEIREPLQRVMK